MTFKNLLSLFLLSLHDMVNPGITIGENMHASKINLRCSFKQRFNHLPLSVNFLALVEEISLVEI